jgi:hypothetical protein
MGRMGRRELMNYHKVIRLPVCGIVVTLGEGSGTITSDLYEQDDDAWNATVDGIEALILGHACAGIDISTPAYLEGVESAIQGAANNA